MPEDSAASRERARKVSFFNLLCCALASILYAQQYKIKMVEQMFKQPSEAHIWSFKSMHPQLPDE